MSRWVYYNDSDPFVCAWLRNLIAAGHLPAGEVDERPIQEVTPDDVRGFTQCHFFAGIGGWALALGLAGWGPGFVWTGSAPCQPFSAAGKGQAEDDQRHLWPHWFRLIRECRPLRIFGEQVPGAAGLGWLDVVATDLEAEGYAVGAAVLGAHSVGAPHLRQRLWFVADTQCGTAERQRLDLGTAPGGAQGEAREREWVRDDAGDGEPTGGVADPDGGQSRDGGLPRSGEHGQQPQDGGAGEQAHTERERPQGRRDSRSRFTPERGGLLLAGPGEPSFWSTCDWLPCRDGKARPVPTESALFPLASGIPNRMGLLRGSGNAIIPQVAAAFVRAYMECRL